MNENKMVADQTTYNFDKRTENYQDDINNYALPQELMVTITLNEYRELLTKGAKEEEEKERLKRYEKEAEIRELEKQIEQLEAKVELLIHERDLKCEENVISPY